MRKLFAGALVAAAVLAPQAAQAQSMEFGADVGVLYMKPSGGSGQFVILAPLGDIRVGFLSRSNMNFEARFNMSFASGGGTFITFDPGLNVLWKLSPQNAQRDGMYITAGADIAIISNKPSGGTSSSGIIPTINAGVGSRMAWGNSAAKRAEVFVAYSMKNTDLGRPNTISVGARLGLSFFH